MVSRRICLLALSLVCGTVLAVPATSPAAVAGTQAWRVKGATNLGAMKSRRMTVTLVLSPRNRAGLDKYVATPHKALRPAQFRARYSPRKTTIKSIRKWARAHKLKVSSVASNRLLVRLSGASPAFARAFHTHFHTFRSAQTGQFFQITSRARLPKAFATKLLAVLGLSSLGRVTVPKPARPSAAASNKLHSVVSGILSSHLGAVPALPAPSSLDYPNQYGPKDFWSMYSAPSGETGSGQPLAIITEGNVSQPKADLAKFESKFGLPAVTWNQINVGTASSDTSGDDEWDLDSQYSTGFAPGVSTLDVYVAPSMSDQDIATTINKWVSQDASKQGSFSAGECELLADASGFLSSVDTILAAGDAQGQTMFFSSGDTGAFCPAVVGVNGVPAGVPDVNYPAASPYGIGVGGTSVLSSSPPPFEIAWYAGGGGPSELEPTPAFQSGTTVGGVAPLVTRGVPDVALDADPESGYEVIVNGTEEVIGGTSASAPSWQGIWARAQGDHGGSLGFAGPVIYRTEPASAFNDITLGANGYPALPGWDYTTGRGTPNITAFVNGA